MLALAPAGCGGGSSQERTSAPARSTRLVSAKGYVPLVSTLELVPGSRDLLLGTNRGLWRVGTDGRLTPVPQNLGLIASEDGGRTWRSVSELGAADLHELALADGRIYGWDALSGALLTSTDNGRTFTRHPTPRSTVVDLAVDPRDPEHLLLATRDQLFRTTDGGRTWRPLRDGETRLAWTAPDTVLRADPDGTVYASDADAQRWTRLGTVDGAPPYRFRTTSDPRHLFLALADGSIVETTDGGRTWKRRLQA